MFKKMAVPMMLLISATSFSQGTNIGLFDQCNYTGKSYYLTEGSYRAYQLSVGNDKLSSIQVPKGMRVTIYMDDNYKGAYQTYTSDISCLPEGYNDNTSSIVVENIYNNNPWNNSNDYITFYNDCYSKGYSKSLKPGTYNGTKLGILKQNISSFTINGDLQVRVYTNSDNASGYGTVLETNQTCLSSSFNDKIRSLVIEYKSGNNGYPNNNYPNNNYPNNNYPNNNNEGYVTFYNDCYSKGYSQTLYPGTYYGSQLGTLKQNISSFTINGSLRVKVYLNNDNASGYSYNFEASESCLTSTYNDKIRSLVIEYSGTGNNNNYPNNNYPNNNYPNNGSNYATIYTDCYYKGNTLKLEPGSYQGDKLGLFKYNISSIELPTNLRAKVYVNNEYLNGTSYFVSESTSCLSNTLNNQIASLVIEEKGYGNNGNNNYPNNNYPNNNNQEKVIIYSDSDYKGLAVSLLPGTYATMTELGFPDNSLSSLYLPAGYRVVLYEFENFQGDKYTINQSKSGFILSNWNDKTSSIAVYRN